MGETLDYLRTFAQFPVALQRFSRHTLTLDEARQTVAERLAHREANFLRLVERSIYGHAASPYRALLKMAGCELGDLQQLVRREGLEGALANLRAAGVYVTFEEFKGRRLIRRGSHEIAVKARDFDNPHARRHFNTRTGGSTGQATSISQNLDHIVAATPGQMLMLATHGLLNAPAGVWIPILPGGGISFVLRAAHMGLRNLAWFSSIGWRDSKYWLKYDAATLYIVLWARALGVNVPWPQIVRNDEALIVARWMHETIQRHGRCFLYTSVSQGLRACVAAEAAGLDLTGATIRGGGEPTTPAKAQAMQRSGVRSLAGYGSSESGSIAVACSRPAAADDMHLLTDAFALIVHPHRLEPAGLTVPAFNLTTLLDTGPKLMLNMQADDCGILETRPCGCGLEAYGFTTHLREVRSYGKLVGEAVTLIGNEMHTILEEELPARFGGSPLDYQLLEEEDGQGFTRLYLVISPRLAIADEGAVLEVLYAAMSRSSPTGDAARIVWEQAKTIRIRRAEPVTTARGKLMLLHINRSAQVERS